MRPAGYLYVIYLLWHTSHILVGIGCGGVGNNCAVGNRHAADVTSQRTALLP